MKRARYEDNQTVPVGGMDTSVAFTLAADTASAALTEGVYWIAPVSVDIWVRIDAGTVNPVAEAAANSFIPYGSILPIRIDGGLKVIASGKVNVTLVN